MGGHDSVRQLHPTGPSSWRAHPEGKAMAASTEVPWLWCLELGVTSGSMQRKGRSLIFRPYFSTLTTRVPTPTGC